MPLLCQDNASATLVFKPGSSATGPGVYNAWSDLMTALAALRASNSSNGLYTILFDDSVTSPCVVPAGTYDMRNVTWEGPPGRIPTTSAYTVEMANGAHFTDLLSFKSIAVLNKNTSTPAVALTPVVTGDLIVIIVDYASDLSSISGAQPMFAGSGLASGDVVICFLNYGSSFGLINSAGPVLDLPVSGTTLYMTLGHGSAAAKNTVTGVAGATVINRMMSSGGEFPTYSGFSGTQGESPQNAALQAWPRFLLNPTFGVAPATSAITGGPGVSGVPGYMHGNLLRLDSTSAGFTQTLPSINAPTGGWKRPGGFIGLKNYGTANTVTVAAASGDTIDGQASFPLNAGETAWLVCDGASRWLRMIRPPANGVWFNTSDEVTNYEKFTISWLSDVLTMRMTKGGTGTTRNIKLLTNDGSGIRLVDGGYLGLVGATVQKVVADADTSALYLAGKITTSTANPNVRITNEASASINTAASGIQKHIRADMTLNQSGAAGYTVLSIEATETATGSGAKLLIDAMVGGSSKFSVDNAGVIDAAGGLRLKAVPAAKTADYTLVGSDFAILFDTTGAARTANLPAAASVPRAIFIVRNSTGANNVTIDPNASETIDGAATATVTPGGFAAIQSDGSAWFTIFN